MRLLVLACLLGGCSSDNPVLDASVADGVTPDGTAPDGEVDARCALTASMITVHPHAIAQPTVAGRTLVDTRGWHGRLYFGYGDLSDNTGPIEISSLDPVTNTWVDHFLFQTHMIERFLPIGDQLWVPAAQPMGAGDYTVGSATHEWPGTVDIGTAYHVVDVVERVPGDIYLVGEVPWASHANVTSASAWRSPTGGPFTEIFPEYHPEDERIQNNQLNAWFFSAVALHGTVYVGFGWTHDGAQWLHPAVDLGQFVRPVTFADHIVSATLHELWASDGTTTMRNLHVTLYRSQGIAQTTLAPLSIFQATEGHLIAVAEDLSVMETTDLQTWRCVGKAPADVTSIGSLDGTIYFGALEGRVYALPERSW